MDEVVIPFQVSKGMDVRGSFAGQEEEDLYVWIRGFQSEEDRERLYRAVYESERWVNELGPKCGQMLDREATVVIRLEPTPESFMR
jgi:hypothetical protein